MVDNPTPTNPALKSGPVPPRQQWQPPAQAQQAQPVIPEVDPARERVDRDETHQIERRRRKGGNRSIAWFNLSWIAFPKNF
jgi:hypothetical protein